MKFQRAPRTPPPFVVGIPVPFRPPGRVSETQPTGGGPAESGGPRRPEVPFVGGPPPAVPAQPAPVQEGVVTGRTGPPAPGTAPRVPAVPLVLRWQRDRCGCQGTALGDPGRSSAERSDGPTVHGFRPSEVGDTEEGRPEGGGDAPAALGGPATLGHGPVLQDETRVVPPAPGPPVRVGRRQPEVSPATGRPLGSGDTARRRPPAAPTGSVEGPQVGERPGDAERVRPQVDPRAGREGGRGATGRQRGAVERPPERLLLPVRSSRSGVLAGPQPAVGPGRPGSRPPADATTQRVGE